MWSKYGIRYRIHFAHCLQQTNNFCRLQKEHPPVWCHLDWFVWNTSLQMVQKMCYKSNKNVIYIRLLPTTAEDLCLFQITINRDPELDWWYIRQHASCCWSHNDHPLVPNEVQESTICLVPKDTLETAQVTVHHWSCIWTWTIIKFHSASQTTCTEWQAWRSTKQNSSSEAREHFIQYTWTWNELCNI